MTDAKSQNGRERRMVLRLLEAWRDAKGTSSFPTPAQMDEIAMPDLYPFCIVLDVTEDPTDPVVTAIGRSISSYAEGSLLGLPTSRFATDTLPFHAVAYVAEVLRKGVPISRGGSFVDKSGVTILYRSIVAPIAADGETVTGLIVAANCREVAGG